MSQQPRCLRRRPHSVVIRSHTSKTACVVFSQALRSISTYPRLSATCRDGIWAVGTCMGRSMPLTCVATPTSGSRHPGGNDYTDHGASIPPIGDFVRYVAVESAAPDACPPRCRLREASLSQEIATFYARRLLLYRFLRFDPAHYLHFAMWSDGSGVGRKMLTKPVLYRQRLVSSICESRYRQCPIYSGERLQAACLLLFATSCTRCR